MSTEERIERHAAREARAASPGDGVREALRSVLVGIDWLRAGQVWPSMDYDLATARAALNTPAPPAGGEVVEPRWVAAADLIAERDRAEAAEQQRDAAIKALAMFADPADFDLPDPVAEPGEGDRP